MSGLNQDVAELPEASQPAEFPADAPPDELRDLFDVAIRAGHLPAAYRAVCFGVIDCYFKQRSSTGDHNASAHEAVAELLQLFTSYENSRVHAYAYLILLDRCPLSETDVARLCNVTRAYVSKVKREVQERLGMTCRVGRSEESRAATAERRRSEPKRKHLCLRAKSNARLMERYSKHFAPIMTRLNVSPMAPSNP